MVAGAANFIRWRSSKPPSTTRTSLKPSGAENDKSEAEEE